jgi:hypothetical protein
VYGGKDWLINLSLVSFNLRITFKSHKDNLFLQNKKSIGKFRYFLILSTKESTKNS